MSRYTIADVQRDWHCLDVHDFIAPVGVHLVSNEEFTYRPGFETVEYVPPGRLSSYFHFFPIFFNFLYALKLLRHTKHNCVLLICGSSRVWFFIGVLNHFMIRKRDILIWSPFVEVADGWKRLVMQYAMSTIRLIAVWSRKQIDPHAAWLKMPRERFIFLPYKANHSKGPSYNLPIGNYVFAGGNSKRDYQTLIEAVRGTGIPVIISATDPAVRKQIEMLPNGIALVAREPAFAQLQAGARLVVVPLADTKLRSAGEANICNGMWHGKPVIAVDRMAADDYIIEGETGYIVPPGDAVLLRRRILELWNDPGKCHILGQKAKEHADANFTHEIFIRRLLRLAKLCGEL